MDDSSSHSKIKGGPPYHACDEDEENCVSGLIACECEDGMTIEGVNSKGKNVSAVAKDLSINISAPKLDGMKGNMTDNDNKSNLLFVSWLTMTIILVLFY